MMNKEKRTAKPEFALAEVFRFTEDDLEANQQGLFSPIQRDELFAQSQMYRSYALLVLIIGLAISVMFFILGLIIPPGDLNLGALIIMILGIAGSGSHLLSWRSKKLAQTIEHGVQIAEGRVNLIIDDGGRYNVYYVILGDLRFTITKAQFLAFKNGDPYALYYQDDPRKLLSAEWLYQQGQRDV